MTRSIVKDGKHSVAPGALSHVRTDLGNDVSLTIEPPESGEIDAKEGITEHGLQLYVLDVVGWRHRAFIKHLSSRGVDFSKDVVQWAAARGWIRVEGLYRPSYDCLLDGVLLVQVLPDGKRKVIRERRFEPLVADIKTDSEINLTVRYA